MSAKARYDAMTDDRWQFLQRARHNAMLTIPSLMPLEGHDGKAHLWEPYQALGARGVVSMSSRLTLALIPAGRPHLRLSLPPSQVLEAGGETDPEFTRQLAVGEQLIQASVERANWRKTTLETVQQLMVAGSVIEHFMSDQTVRTFRLDQFVLARDHRGVVMEAIIREFINPDNAPDGVTVSKKDATSSQTIGTEKKDEKDVELYTWIKLKDDVYTVSQETGNGKKVSKDLKFEMDELPYLFLRWSATPGEDYGRSKVEEVIGDLRSLDALTKSALEMGAMGAKHFTMVRPGANANGLRNRIDRAANGAVLVGDPETVELKNFANAGGYQIVQDQMQKLSESIANAFLLLSAQQRNAERVTATEIERDIQELESTLGGVFSTLSLEMLDRRTELLIEDMKRKKEFPPVEKGDLDITILTGLEALSRERDVSRGVQAAQIASQFGEQGVAALKLDVILSKIMVGLGFPDAVKSAEEMAQAQQAAQQQAMMDKLGPAALQVAGKSEAAQQAIGEAVAGATGGGEQGG